MSYHLDIISYERIQKKECTYLLRGKIAKIKEERKP